MNKILVERSAVDSSENITKTPNEESQLASSPQSQLLVLDKNRSTEQRRTALTLAEYTDELRKKVDEQIQHAAGISDAPVPKIDQPTPAIVKPKTEDTEPAHFPGILGAGSMFEKAIAMFTDMQEKLARSLGPLFASGGAWLTPFESLFGKAGKVYAAAARMKVKLPPSFSSSMLVTLYESENITMPFEKFCLLTFQRMRDAEQIPATDKSKELTVDDTKIQGGIVTTAVQKVAEEERVQIAETKKKAEEDAKKAQVAAALTPQK